MARPCLLVKEDPASWLSSVVILRVRKMNIDDTDNNIDDTDNTVD